MSEAIFCAGAALEAGEAFRYYAERLPSLGVSFLLDLEEAGRQIAARPGDNPPAGGEIRRRPLRRFPFTLFYAVESGHVIILAVGHHGRRPGCRG